MPASRSNGTVLATRRCRQGDTPRDRSGRQTRDHLRALNAPGDPVWDLRRGDGDDNRTSPYGRGWRSLLIATALEFNYVSATLAFITLVMVPALLVGLAPPLLLIYTRHKVDAASTLWSHPFAAVISIALLIGLALRIGRPLLSMFVESLWHLHYTLVFPLFVGLRETISAAIERTTGEVRASEALDRRRRLGTIVAAIVLAGGSLLLAVSVGVLERPQLGDVMIQPWAVARAGVRNAVILLSLSTAGASLFWLGRELTSRRPLRDWTPELPMPQPAVVRVAHLSDLHIVGERYGFRMESGTHGPAGNARMQEALDTLRAINASTPLDRVLVTGDITDAGTRAEWIEFIDLLRRCPDIRSRVLFVPGNHDVNVVDRTNAGRFELPWGVSHALRRLRLVVALEEIQGERVHIVDGVSGDLGPTLRDYLHQREPLGGLRELAERGTWRGRRALARVWDDLFPLVAPPGEPDGCGAILLDSNVRSHFSATNAIGVIGRSQLRKLRAVLRAFPRRAWMILLHHHVVEYPIASVKLSDRIVLSLMNAPDLLAAIAPYGSHVVIFHGHRHRDWIGTKGDVVLCSAPSVTLGSKGLDLSRGCFHVNDLVLAGGGVVRLVSSERVTVS